MHFRTDCRSQRAKVNQEGTLRGNFERLCIRIQMGLTGHVLKQAGEEGEGLM